jgi:hypothetical protein
MADESSMAEKRRILREEQISSYRAHAEANADLELGGRYAKVTKTTIVGASPISYPALPETSPSNQAAMVGDEPSLGYDINAMEPVGEPHERQEAEVPGKGRARGWRRI